MLLYRVVNAGKSKQNEDQAAAGHYSIKCPPQEPVTETQSPDNGPAPIAQTKVRIHFLLLCSTCVYLKGVGGGGGGCQR